MIAELALLAVWFFVAVVVFVALAEQAADRNREMEYARYLNRRRKILAERYGFAARVG